MSKRGYMDWFAEDNGEAVSGDALDAASHLG